MTAPMEDPSLDAMLVRESIANKPKYWVRAVTACNSKCLFCLDSDTPRNLYLPEDEVKREIVRGREELGAEKIIISGGEASLHPKFPEFIRFALDEGYDRVQTVTNGWRFADKDFFDTVMDAGLGEITFSLHGHTPELHDHLTQHPGSFKRLIKGLVRALRDGRPIVNVDVVINKQNVGVLDKIIELCFSLGVTEYDLLHVIPQAAAYDHRDDLFYDPTEHLETLHKVFRLNRHPRFVIWTNRFPVSFLEGLEDLIQDPHKMLDEINGRRHMVRRYLDHGKPLDCREPERCKHCFIQPLCNTMDGFIADQHSDRWDVWWLGTASADGPGAMPFGSRFVGLDVETLASTAALDAYPGLYLKTDAHDDLAGLPPVPTVLVAQTAEQCDAWLLSTVRPDVEVDVHLTRSTATWLRSHADALATVQRPWRIHQPAYETLREAKSNDVADPYELVGALGGRPRVSGLAPCLAPGAELIDERRVVSHRLFDGDTGRPVIRELAKHHVAEHYRAKSLRCRDCMVNDRCAGIHINRIRANGLALARPLVAGEHAEDAKRQLVARWPLAPLTLAAGRQPEPAAPSLPGFPEPSAAPADPLSVLARQRTLDREARRKRRQQPEGS